MNARLASALLVLSACTVYRVPEDADSDAGQSSGGSKGASSGGGETAWTGELTTDDGSTSTSTSTTTTTTTTTTDPSTTANPATTDDPPPLQCDFPTAIQPIFDERCGCHNGGMPPKGLVLAKGSAFDNLVGVDSMEQPGTPRVDPGNSAGSWLVTKLKPMPPAGSQMPEGGMLDAAQVALIATWIDAGAPEAGAFACEGGGAGSVTIDEPGPFQVEIGELLDLDVTVLDGQGNPVQGSMVTWKSSSETTLYVDAKGTLLGVAPGTVEVTAEVGDLVSPPVSVEVKVNDPVATSFADVLGMVTTNCGCHKGGMPKAGLAFDLAPADVYAALLGPSMQQPMVQRIAKDAPGQSYLFQKLTLATPATGGQMPQGKAPLEAEKVQVVIRWILAGAPE